MAIVDGKPSYVTSEAYEFYRGQLRRRQRTRPPRRCSRPSTAWSLRNPDDYERWRGLAENVQKPSPAAVGLRDGTARASPPTASRRWPKEETGRADEMTKACSSKPASSSRSPTCLTDSPKVIPAGAMALKAIKDPQEQDGP